VPPFEDGLERVERKLAAILAADVDTVWDRTTFLLLSILFQTTIGKVENVGIPITISK